MTFFRRFFDFYLESSIHTALSCFALVRITQQMFNISNDNSIAGFAFFGTIVGYNFVKYAALARNQKRNMESKLKVVWFLSFICFIIAGFYFFKLSRNAQTWSFVFLSLTLLYTLPFFPNRKNARNWAGIKIYIVALCWVGVTVVLPIFNAQIALTTDFYLKAVQRFVLLFILILLFEIVDLKSDALHLRTVPQQIGVRRTKILGWILLFPFYFMEFLKTKLNPWQLVVNLVLAISIGLFLFFANQNRSKYYSSFWVESVPIFWYLLMLTLNKNIIY